MRDERGGGSTEKDVPFALRRYVPRSLLFASNVFHRHISNVFHRHISNALHRHIHIHIANVFHRHMFGGGACMAAVLAAITVPLFTSSSVSQSGSKSEAL